MNSEQYRLLLEDLARVSAMGDSVSLLEHGRLKVGELEAVLEHEPTYDDKLLQLRMRIGSLPRDSAELTRAILEANYVGGYGGECVFSLFPATDDVVVTMRLRLEQSLTAQELWQSMSDLARHASQMWQGITAAVHSLDAGTPSLSGNSPVLRA